VGISLTPVVADRVGKNVAIPVEGCGSNASTDLRIALESVLRIFVPEVESPVRSGRGKCTMNWMKRYGVDRKDLIHVTVGRVRLAMAFEGKV